MIHHAILLKPGRAIGFLVAISAVSLVSGGCAGAGKDYPSFAIPPANANAGGVSMRFPAVAVPDLRTVNEPEEALPAELDAALAAINNRAMAANAGFSASSNATNAFVAKAVGTARESDAWAEAQLRIARLVTHHSDTHLALADLDQLAVTADLAQSTPDKLAMIADLRSNLVETLAQQARQLTAISAQLEP